MLRKRLFACFFFAVAMAGIGCAPEADTETDAVSVAGTESIAPVTTSTDYGIPGSRERFEIQKALISDKLEKALLPAMRNHNIDLWIVLDRENNPDPLHVEIGGRFSGVRAAYVFFDNGGDALERIYYGSHEQPANSVISQIYDEKIYYGYSKEGLTPHLRKLIYDKDPKKIGVNTSHTLPEADGLTVGLKNFLVDTIGPEYANRIVSAELIVRDFRLNRTERETELYTKLLEWSAMWMQEALSTANVVTGKTTAADIAWWLQDRALELGVTGGGTVRVVREGVLLPVHDPHITVEPGDIIGIDGGLDYLGYAVDIKRTAYILQPGESVMSENLLSAWKAAHDMGDIYASKMVPGSVGHENWESINREAEAMGYRAVGPDSGGDAVTTNAPEVGIYGHSVGNVAHDIGARVAADLPFAYGDRVRFPLVANEWASIELHVSTPIPEWGGKTWYARFEETAQITEDGPKWLIPPQTDVFLIEPAN
jgi:Xaa-Pro dipeptidase